MSVQIIIKGERTDPRDWREAQAVPTKELRPLTSEQKAVVAKLKLSEEGYARTILASARTQKRLIDKAEQFGLRLQKKLEASPGVEIRRIILALIELQYYVELGLGKQTFQIRFDESTVDDLLEGGSQEAGSRVDGILERILADRVA